MSNDNVMIIGAGPAGCAAAYTLAQRGLRVQMFERLAQPGGLSRTIERNRARYDIGPHRFFTKAPRVLELWRSVGAEMLREVPRLTRILYGKKLLHYPLQPMNALLGMGVWKSMQAVLSYAQVRLVRLMKPRTAVTFEEWIVDQFGAVLYEAFFKTYTEKVWGIPCHEIGAEWASQRIKGLNLTRAVINALTGGKRATVKTLVDRFIYPQYGAGTMYERMLEHVLAAGGSVAFDTEVVALHHDGTHIRSIRTQTTDGKTDEHAVGQVVSSMPLTDLVLCLTPAPPPEVIAAARGLLYRTHLAVELLVKGSPFPDNWIYVHTPTVHMGRVANYRNFSPLMCPDDDHSPLTIEYFTFDGDPIETLSDTALIDLAIKESERVGLLAPRVVQDAFVVRNRQAYCVIQRGYQEKCRIIQAYLERFRNLHPVGRAGMFKYNNQDHSIMTALLAADNITGAGFRSPWNVNIDAEYHESGTAPDVCVEDREDVRHMLANK